jgi:hypothetical protein
MNEKKTVRLFLGEGPDRVEVGTADVEHREGGTVIANMNITNPDYKGLLFDSYLAKPNPLIKRPELSFGADIKES